jgi:uncharacterized protein YdbL (DUF1318 family)
MKTIGDLLSRDLSRKIEEITQVDQKEHESVFAEITEYIPTDAIRGHYETLLKAIAEAPADPHEGIGVWVSGFFGSGKSSFAKNLGYVVQNPEIMGQRFADLFKKQIGSRKVSDLVDVVNTQIPTDVILFDVSKQNDIRTATERIAEKIYTVVLRELGYAEDFDIAELEIELEAESRLAQFEETCKQLHDREWRIIRKGAQKYSRASAVLHALDSKTYPNADSWAHAQADRKAKIDIPSVVARTFELAGRRRPGKALFFVIDEVGQHVARSGDKIEDLRATVEEFGKVGKNLRKARKIVAPCWIVVTSQEKLDEVVAAIDSRRVDLAKLQDRFHYRVDLAPSDIREVATKRVLAKKDDALPVLTKLFHDNQGGLTSALRLERTKRPTELTEADFVQFYPYPPHYIDLCINVMSGIRLQPGAPRHFGGSNRTIIKQAYEMLVNDRTAIATQPVGTLVTLDKVYELVEGNLTSEKRQDISDIAQRITDDEGWSLRVAKVICLLEFVRDLPRTEANIAAFLIDAVGKPAPLAEVQQAVKRLQDGQFIRSTDEGWKLQTAQEKNWDTERRNHLDPSPRRRGEIARSALEDVFTDPALKTYRHKDKTFRVGINADGNDLTEGDLAVSLRLADDAGDFQKLLDQVRDDSRQPSHTNDLYWVAALTTDIDQLVEEVNASKAMIDKYKQLRAQNKISPNESECLRDEESLEQTLRSRLRDKLTDALESGTGMFRGVASDASSLGKTLGEIVKKFLGKAVPDLYPKLEMASRSLAGDEAEKLLTSDDLKKLPPVCYPAEGGLSLVIKDGAMFVPNTSADPVKEVLDYLVAEQSYGNKDSRYGKALEKKFGGVEYGWERDMLRLLLAVLFRAGAIEVTTGGQKYDSYKEPASRGAFTSNPTFKSALFTPIKPIDLKTLRKAVECYESLTGATVAMDKDSIAEAFKKLAAEELKTITPVEIQAKTNKLPVQRLEEYRDSLQAIGTSTADECVATLAGGGVSLNESKEQLKRLRDALTDSGLQKVQHARVAVEQMWPLLEQNGQADHADTAKAVGQVLQHEEFYKSLPELEAGAISIGAAYHAIYEKAHTERAEQYRQAIERLKGCPEWAMVPEPMQGPILGPLMLRCCETLDLPPGELVCRNCTATLGQLNSDIVALGGLFANAVLQIQKATAPPEQKIERVRVSTFFATSIDNEEQVKESVSRLQDHLLKLLDEGVKIVLE